jgi:hypothetical protein
MCLIDGAMEGSEEPGKPLGDIHGALLGPFQHVIVGPAIPLELRGQTVEALWDPVGTRKEKIADGPGDAGAADDAGDDGDDDVAARDD